LLLLKRAEQPAPPSSAPVQRTAPNFDLMIAARNITVHSKKRGALLEEARPFETD